MSELQPPTTEAALMNMDATLLQITQMLSHLITAVVVLIAAQLVEVAVLVYILMRK